MLDFSSLILDLHALAETHPPEKFAPVLVQRLQTYLGSDLALLGLEDGTLYASRRRELALGFENACNIFDVIDFITASNLVAEITRDDQQITALFRRRTFIEPLTVAAKESDESTKLSVGLAHGNRAHPDEAARWILIGWAEDDASMFSVEPLLAEVVQAIWSHIGIAVTRNFEKELEQDSRCKASRCAALVSWSGHIEFADWEFIELVGKEFAFDASGPLPESLLSTLANQQTFVGHTMSIKARAEPSHLVCLAEPLPHKATLAPSERMIVRHLIHGLSYPAIAAKLGKSPHTIRNQIVSIYRKLGVEGKVALIQLIDRRPDLAASAE